jgi:hypothetical protein
LDFTLICDGNELELYDVKQDHSNSMRAFVASEAGKVSVPGIDPLIEHEKADLRSAIQNHGY